MVTSFQCRKPNLQNTILMYTTVFDQKKRTNCLFQYSTFFNGEAYCNRNACEGTSAPA